MNSVFSFAFIQALVKRLPPELAERVGRICEDKGFESLLSAYFASPEAMNMLIRSVVNAALTAEKFPAEVHNAKLRILDGVEFGVKQRG